MHLNPLSARFGVAALLAATLCGCSKAPPEKILDVKLEETPPAAAEAAPVPTSVPAPGTDWSDTPGLAAAMQDVRTRGLYTVLVLHKAGDRDSRGLAAQLQSLAAAASNAACVVADVANPDLAVLFQALKVDRATLPMPMALVMATNALVTGTFTAPPPAERFSEALLPAQPLAVRSALAAGKKVIVTVQSARTAGNEETTTGVAAYLAGATNRNAFATVLVSLDAKENGPFLRQLKVNPTTETQSVTLIMAPPLKILAAPLRGAVTKEILTKALSACSAGACGPSG